MQAIRYITSIALINVLGCHFEGEPGALGYVPLIERDQPRPMLPSQAGSASAAAGRRGGEYEGDPRSDSGVTAGMSAAGTTAAGSGGIAAPPPTELASEWAMLGYDLASTYNNSAERALTKANARTLRLKFSVELGETGVYGAPLLVGGKLYFNAGAEARAYDLATGNELWTSAFAAGPQDAHSSMAYADGVLYLQLADGTAALDAATGLQLWQYAAEEDAPPVAWSSPIVAGDLVLLGRANDAQQRADTGLRGSLTALHTADGTPAWVALPGAGIESTVSVDLARGWVYASTIDHLGGPASESTNAFMAFELSSGNRRFTVQFSAERGLGHGFGANPVLYEAAIGGEMVELLAAGAQAGSVHAVRTDRVEQVWSAYLGAGSVDGDHGIVANTSWSGNHVLVALNDGRPGDESATLYALDAATGATAWQRSLPGDVLGRITIANGVGFVGAGSVLYVFDTDTGELIHQLPTQGIAAGVTSIANGMIAFGTAPLAADGAGVFVYEVEP